MNRRWRWVAATIALAAAGIGAFFAVYAPPLPSARSAYRSSAEFRADIAQLAKQFPAEARVIALPNRSILGQEIDAIEISRDVANSGWKPTLLITGLHHAREWPSAELSMEFAWDLLSHASSDSTIATLLDRARVLVVPVVNPDGLDASQKTGTDGKRKNCNLQPDVPASIESCANTSPHEFGVDINRNYAAFWGGAGSNANPDDILYRGVSPQSEPETQNLVWLLSHYPILVAIANHTREGLVMRLPSSADEPPLPDASLHDSLARSFARALRFQAGDWPTVYEGSNGTIDQLAYYAFGALPFTFEFTPRQAYFHPPFRLVRAQYYGKGRFWRSSAREAMRAALQATANSQLHAVLRVRAPSGSTVELLKDVSIETSRVAGRNGDQSVATSVPLHFAAELHIPDGKTEMLWHVSPSLRANQRITGWLRESWQLRCRSLVDTMRTNVPTISAMVARGDTATVDLSSCQ